VAFTLVEAGDTEGWARAGLSAFALGSVALAFRRVVTHHALLSYLFGAVILAVAINSVAGLLEQ
jgi:hypothetical protein